MTHPVISKQIWRPLSEGWMKWNCPV